MFAVSQFATRPIITPDAVVCVMASGMTMTHRPLGTPQSGNFGADSVQAISFKLGCFVTDARKKHNPGQSDQMAVSIAQNGD